MSHRHHAVLADLESLAVEESPSNSPSMPQCPDTISVPRNSIPPAEQRIRRWWGVLIRTRSEPHHWAPSSSITARERPKPRATARDLPDCNIDSTRPPSVRIEWRPWWRSAVAACSRDRRGRLNAPAASNVYGRSLRLINASVRELRTLRVDVPRGGQLLTGSPGSGGSRVARAQCST